MKGPLTPFGPLLGTKTLSLGAYDRPEAAKRAEREPLAKTCSPNFISSLLLTTTLLLHFLSGILMMLTMLCDVLGSGRLPHGPVFALVDSKCSLLESPSPMDLESSVFGSKLSKRNS